MSSALQSNLAKHGFVTPTPVQARSIPPALAGRDLVATAQTGTGKTLAFALPLVERLSKIRSKGVRAVVLSPTRELAIQIDETFQKIAENTGLRTAVVVGGLGEGKQLDAIRRGAQVVIATPGRLVDFLDRRLVKLDTVETIVLDEADRMLDMGFLPALKTIQKHLPAQRQTMLFSATIEKSVAHLVDSYVRNAERVAIGAVSKPIQLVTLHAYEVQKDRKLPLLEHLLRHQDGSCLVFVRTKRGADRLAKKLASDGVKATRIHGDRTQGQRNQALDGFKKGSYRVLVATDVAARGIHADGIAHVVNFDLPQVPEDFIHRVGRTGRAGASGLASTFVMPEERKELNVIEREMKVKLERMAVPGPVLQAALAAKAAPAASAPVVVKSASSNHGKSLAPKAQHHEPEHKPANGVPAGLRRVAVRSFSPRRRASR